MEIENADEDLDLGLLRTFLAVIRHGTMAGAAVSLKKTQPAVSQRILQLERTIGQRLFLRKRGGLRLTTHGELLVEYAYRAIDLNEEALACVRRQSVSGSVRIGFSEEGLVAQLAPAFKRFQRTYPDVDLTLTVARPLNLEFMLNGGALDFAVSDLTETAVHPLLEWESRPAWFASVDLVIDPLAPLPLVLSHVTAHWRDQIFDALRASGWSWRVVLEGTNLDATLSAVESGLGVSVLLREAIRRTGIQEIRHLRLPALPKVPLGMFRCEAPLTRAQSLLAAALSAALGRARAQEATAPGDTLAWTSSDSVHRGWSTI